MKHDVSPHSEAVRWHLAADGQSPQPEDHAAPPHVGRELREIASLVRPLPDSVQPAPAFVERMHDQLLRLPAAVPSSDSLGRLKACSPS